ncbi:hypothetical protein COTS27_01533 [Spirochaetota bacterium]|nr:hypothetical protein COTS27_01533 [Spirochaetota bacterium]
MIARILKFLDGSTYKKWLALARHPYITLRIKYVLGRILLVGSLWLAILGVYHIVYVVINLSEAMPIKIERLFLWAYVWIGSGAAVIVWLATRLKKPFAAYLEDNFDLAFKWYNALAEAKQRIENIPPARAQAILGKIRLRRAIKSEKYFFGVGYALIAVLFVMHLSMPTLTERFRSNVQALMLATTYQYDLTYPPRVNQGTDWQIDYEGDYDTAAFYLGTRQVFTLRSGMSDVLANVTSSFTVTALLTKGRVKKTLLLPITVTPPPILEAVTINVFHLPTGKESTSSGVKRLLIDQPSRVKGTLSYRGSSPLAAAAITVRTNTAGKGAIRTLDYKLLPAKPDTSADDVAAAVVDVESTAKAVPNSVVFSTVVRASSQVVIVMTDIYGQTSTAHEIDFVVRGNLPPTVTIETPPPSLTLFELQDIPVTVTAQDDIALGSLVLVAEARSDNNDLLWETNLLYPLAQIRGKTFVNDTFTLPLLARRTSTGTRFFYWAQVKDYAGLTTVSSKQVISYLPKSDFFKQSQAQSGVIEKGLNQQNENIETLSKQYEQLEILSEKKTLERKDIKRFGENTLRLNEELRKEQESIEALERNLDARKTLSPTLQKKLGKLKETLAEIDQDLLQKLARNSQKLLKTFATNISPAELRKEIDRLSINRIEQRIDETMKLLENFKTLQELNNLKELAQNLYERFRDLEGYMAYEDLSIDEIEAETGEIAKELSYMKEQFASLEKDLVADERSDRLKKAIKKDLTAPLISEFDKVARNRTNSDFIKKRSAQLDRLRKNFVALTHSTSEQELEEALAELNYQIFMLGEKTFEMAQIMGGERYAKQVLREHFLRGLLSKYSSSEKTMLKKFKDALEGLSGAGILDLSVFEIYDQYINRIETLQRTIDPSAQLTQQKKISASKEFSDLVAVNNNLSALLIDIKKNLLREKELRDLQNTLADAAKDQRGLNQRTQNWFQQQNNNNKANGLSRKEREYFKSLLAEQAYIRQLLENLSGRYQQRGQGKQSGSEGSGGKEGQQGQKGGGQQNGNSSKTGTGTGTGDQDGTFLGGTGGKGVNDTNALNGEGNQSGKGENLPAGNSLAHLVTQMRELENELIKRNPDLARVKRLQALIENNLLRHGEGIDKEQDQADREDKRQAESDFTPYLSPTLRAVERENLYLIEEKLTKLRDKNNYPAEYRKKIEVFLRALRQSLNSYVK